MSSFADILVTQSTKGSTKLEQIESVLNWKVVDKKLQQLIRRGKMGRPPYPLLSLFKVLVLQRLYDLSDPQMEEMLYDRLSFRRFCDFGLSDKLPDETTICRFRGVLGNKVEKILEVVLQDLDEQGLSMKGGAIVDATVISSKSSRPKGGEVSETDPEAGWTKKGGQYHHGYKMHTCVDDEHGLIQSLEVTSADVHDSLVFGQILASDDRSVYADKAYDSQKNRDLLKRHNIEDRVLYKGRRNHKQPQWQKELNKIWNKTRSGVERTFAHLKGQQGLGQARYFGVEKTKQWAIMNAIAYNLRRAIRILPPPQLSTG